MLRNCFTVILLLVSSSLIAEIQPVCDVDCTPDTGGSGYGAVVRARPTPPNSRGNNQVLPSLGSQSYNYAISIVSLPGRNGLDLNLTLHYNSRIWIVDKVNIPRTATLNADRDFPSYGFRLDFGYLEFEARDRKHVCADGGGRH